jgi:hypothetical protein
VFRAQAASALGMATPPRATTPSDVAEALMNAKDLLYIARARRKGARFAWHLIRWAKATGVQYSLALAICEQETGFANVFGHDPTIAKGWGKVTKASYLTYKRMRGPTGRGGMQGVGPMQLTWWEFQDRADKLGGCWLPSRNIRVGLEVLASNIRQHGRHTGIARYNGTGSAAENYARSVESKQRRWHAILTGK